MPAPRITLLPGLDGTGALYEPLLEALGPDVAVTRVGYDPRATQTRAALLSIAQAALPVGQRTLLVGESFSGPLAISLAFRCPEAISHVVLLASFCSAPHRLTSLVPPLAPILFSRPAPRAVLRRYFLGGTSSPAVVEAARTAMASVAPAVVAQRLQIVSETRVGPELAQLPMPVHLVYGSADRLIDAPRAAAECLTFLPDAHEHCIPDGPHLLALASPVPVAGLLRGLLGRPPHAP